MDDPLRSEIETLREQIKLQTIEVSSLRKDRTRALIANSDDERFSKIEAALETAETHLQELQNRMNGLLSG